MVAKTYQFLPIISEPYTINGRQYIQVRDKSGNSKQVRWYSEAEYKRMYPAATATDIPNKVTKSQKEVLGFSNGYITIFKGDTYPYKDFLHAAGARYTRHWGWYFGSWQDELPEIPSTLTPIQLPWEVVGLETGFLKDDKEVENEVLRLTSDPSPSKFVGEIGQRLEIVAKVKAAIPVDGYYGKTIIHTFETEDKNIFVWRTAAKNLEVGSTVHLRGTLKEHSVYKAVNQNILTRCTVLES